MAIFIPSGPWENYDTNASTYLFVCHLGAWTIQKIILNPEVNPKLSNELLFKIEKLWDPLWSDLRSLTVFNNYGYLMSMVIWFLWQP